MLEQYHLALPWRHALRGRVFAGKSCRKQEADMANYETLKIEKDGAVDWVTLNRPDAMNSLNTTMVDELLDYYQSLYLTYDTRVVVMRGAGRCYSAGLDLKESGQRRNTAQAAMSGPAAGLHSQRRISEIVMRMR